MDRLAMVFNSIFSKILFTIIFSALLIMSCEEQVDDLWNADDDAEEVSPLVGDWYADSINFHYSMCNPDSNLNFMEYNYVESYNLWILSDGSFQLVLNQSTNVQMDCEVVNYGTWDSNNGCYYYDYYYTYDYVSATPLQYCNQTIGFNEYNIETTDCSQEIALEGAWQANEASATISLTMDPYCASNSNQWSMATYHDTSTTCQTAENQWNTSIVRDYTYQIDASTGDLSLNWADSDSTCLKFYLAIE